MILEDLAAFLCPFIIPYSLQSRGGSRCGNLIFSKTGLLRFAGLFRCSPSLGGATPFRFPTFSYAGRDFYAGWTGT